MDKSMDAYTGFGITVLFKLLTGFLGRAATGDRSSVAYRTPAKISHRPYLKLSHRKHFSHALIHTCYSVWPHRCCGSACTSPCSYVMSQLQLTSNGDQWEDKRAQNSTTKVSFCTF